MCALALAAPVLPKASKGTARPYADKPQGQWEHLLQILGERPQNGDSFTPTMHSN